jgi:polar amino acid transport system substrate-binding protein
MTKRLAAFLCLVCFAGILSGCETASNPNTPTPRTTVIASGHPEWTPIMYRNGSVIDGAGPALVKKIFAELGLTVETPYVGTWDEVQAKAKTGEVDVLVAAYKTTERQTYMVYSDAYTTDPVAIFVAKGKAFPFSDWNVLLGKHGVAMVGDSYGQQFDDFAAAKLDLTRVTSSAQAFDMVGSGQADYLLYSLYSGEAYLKQTSSTAAFESLPTFVNEENFYITISYQSPFVPFLQQINQLIAKYKADGTIAALIAQYKQ